MKTLYNYQLRETAANAQRPSTNNSIPAHPLTAAVFSIADLLHDTQFEDREYLNNITQKLDSNGEPLAKYITEYLNNNRPSYSLGTDGQRLTNPENDNLEDLYNNLMNGSEGFLMVRKLTY